ncbi:MAG: alpha/beta hydrolase [Burkholderiaceae bacterium]|nr:alpha/beta hydrolase [Burkholderiaceae bacterium]
MDTLLFDSRFALRRLPVNGIEIAVRVDVAGDPSRPPLLLMHGFPQTHAIWHRVAPHLSAHYRLVMPDLRGYGDSAKPPGASDHANYSKRTMAADMQALMAALGHTRYFVCGHDRGGRVAHRLALDQPQAVARLMLLDISPTLTMYERTTREFAEAYYHWFFLIQPAPLPERLIGADPIFYLHRKVGGWGSAGTQLFDARALAEYERCFADPAAIHAMCEDYRAAASIDLEHDRADLAHRIECPVHVLWGSRGVVNRLFTPVSDWQERTLPGVSGRTTPGGHYIPEESPDELVDEMFAFFGPTLA